MGQEISCRHILFGQAMYPGVAFHLLGFCFREQSWDTKMDSVRQIGKIFLPEEKRKYLNFSLLEKLLETGEDLLGKLEEQGVETGFFQFLFRYEFQ